MALAVVQPHRGCPNCRIVGFVCVGAFCKYNHTKRTNPGWEAAALHLCILYLLPPSPCSYCDCQSLSPPFCTSHPSCFSQHTSFSLCKDFLLHTTQALGSLQGGMCTNRIITELKLGGYFGSQVVPGRACSGCPARRLLLSSLSSLL